MTGTNVGQIPEAYVVGGKRQKVTMNDLTKRTLIVVFGIGAVLITFMMLLAKDCSAVDEKRLECIKAGQPAKECACLFKTAGPCQ